MPTVNDFTKLYQYYNELKEKLTVPIDYLPIDSDLISIAQNLILKNIHFVSLLDDSSLRFLFPSISSESIRYRISCHLISLMKDGSCIPMPNVDNSSSLSTGFCSLQHCSGSVLINKRSKFSNSNNYNTNDVIQKGVDDNENMFGMLPEFVLKQFENGETDFTFFFAKFLNLVENVPMRLRANAPVKMTNSVKASSGGSVSGSNNDGGENVSSTSNTQANDQDGDDASGNNSLQSASIDSPIMNLFSSPSSYFTITKYLRLSQNKLFEEINSGLFIPRKDASDKLSIDAFIGFDALLGLRFVSGRSPPLPVSRLVFKAAFGGEVKEDDLLDANIKKKDLPNTDKQLEATRIGVELTVPLASSIVPSDVFARVFQVAPRMKHTVLNIAIPENLSDPVLFPSFRRAVISSHVKFLPEDKQKNVLNEVLQKQSDALNGNNDSNA